MTGRIGLAFAVAALLAAGGPGCNKGDTLASPTLTAECAAAPASGTAPLTVAFSLNVSGAQGAFTVAVSYGDGASGTTPDQPHTYAAPGSYTAAFTVKTTLQSALCSTTVTVSPTPAPTPTPPNQPPDAVFKTNPDALGGTITGKAPLDAAFNMCTTTDPDKDPLSFKMDLDGDGAFEHQGSTGADCRHDTTYAVGTRKATICVTDIACTTWPACAGAPLLHPYQCRSYTVVATP